MPAELLLSALNSHSQRIGEIVDVQEGGHVWLSGEQPPKYVHLTISDASKEEVVGYLSTWELFYKTTVLSQTTEHYTVRVAVDPAYISASAVGRYMMNNRMVTWAEDRWGCTNITLNKSYIDMDVPKPADLSVMKKEFDKAFKVLMDFRRYKFSVADVVTALADDGTITLTKQQALSRVIDKLDT